MKFNIYFLLGQLIILFNHNELTSGIPMVGENVRQAEATGYSYVVSIMKILAGHPHSGGIHFCTGQLITRIDVLTAAHCIHDESLDDTQVVVGTVSLRNGTVFYPFWWITYDQWIFSLNLTLDYNWNDIANIRLLEGVPDNIVPVRISSLANTELYNANVTVAGWGLNNNHVIPEIMNLADLKIIQNRVCERRLERLTAQRIPVDVRLFCTTASPYVLVDDGDSGGPLIFRNRLVAVTHGSCPNTQRRRYRVNLHFGVHYYRHFINYMKTHI